MYIESVLFRIRALREQSTPAIEPTTTREHCSNLQNYCSYSPVTAKAHFRTESENAYGQSLPQAVCEWQRTMELGGGTKDEN